MWSTPGLDNGSGPFSASIDARRMVLIVVNVLERSRHDITTRVGKSYLKLRDACFFFNRIQNWNIFILTLRYTDRREISISYQSPTSFNMVDMTSPTSSTEAFNLRNKGDETARTVAEIAWSGPGKSLTPSTETPPHRASLKRTHSKSPTPKPRLIRSRLGTSQRDLQSPISAAQKGSVAENTTDAPAEDYDLANEQRHLMDKNNESLGRILDPQTPPNRPWLLTEDGLLMTLPVYDESPLDSLDQDHSELRSDLLEEDSEFGGWLPGHGPRVGSPSVLGPRHERPEPSPSDRIIWRRRRGTIEGEFRFGDRLLRQSQVCDALSLVSGHDDQREAEVASMMEWDWRTGSLESRDARPAETQTSEWVEGEVVGSSSRPTRPWEL